MCGWIANYDAFRTGGTSRARFNFSTLTRGSPRSPNWRPSVCCMTNAFHRLFLQTSCTSDSPHLVRRSGRADVRVKPASRGSHEIHRDRRVIARICRSQGGNSRFDRFDQGRIGRPEVRSTGGSGIVRKRRGRRWTAPKILWFDQNTVQSTWIRSPFHRERSGCRSPDLEKAAEPAL